MNAKNKQDGRTVLHIAALYRHADTVSALIECGANVNIQDKSKQTALHLACQSGDLKTVRVLVEAGGAKLMLVLDKLKRPAIMHAVKNGHFEVVKYLLQQGKLMSWVMVMVYGVWCCPSCRSPLLSIPMLGFPADVLDGSENSLLHYAAGYGFQDLVQLLIAAQANPDPFNM